MKKILILLFILSVTSLFSQTKKAADVFDPAYIVTLKGDTLKGFIKIPKAHKAELYQKISFKDDKNKIRLYTPDKISGYGLGNYYYISAFHNNKTCYFKVLSKGKATLLQINFEVNDEGVINEVQDFCLLTEGKEADMKILDEKGIKKQLKEAFKDNKELVKK